MLNHIKYTEVEIQSTVPDLIKQFRGSLQKLQVKFYQQVSGTLKQITESFFCIVRVFF